MSHYTANLRDLEFNLFEFLDTKDKFGTGPFEQMDADTARGVLSEIRRLAEGPVAASFVDADRNPPVFDPATQLGDAARVVQEVGQGHRRRRVVPPRPARAPRRLRRPARADLGRLRDDPRRQPGRLHVRLRRRVRRDPRRARHAGPEAARRDHAGEGLGRHDGAHRARRRLRRGRRHHQGRAAGRRHLAHHRREAVHHLGRARPERQHHPPGPGPPRGREGRHQGAVAVRRPQVPLRPADR